MMNLHGSKFWWNCSVSWLWWWIHNPTHMIKLHEMKHTFKSSWKNREIWIRSRDCIDINIMLIISYLEVLQDVNSGEKWVKGIYILIIVYESTVISKWKVYIHTHTYQNRMRWSTLIQVFNFQKLMSEAGPKHIIYFCLSFFRTQN